MILRQLEVYHVRLKQDNRKKIVEVVSDPSGEAFESLITDATREVFDA